jgi:uncharacterized membrane protein (UPF0127 family)
VTTWAVRSATTRVLVAALLATVLGCSRTPGPALSDTPAPQTSAVPTPSPAGTPQTLTQITITLRPPSGGAGQRIRVGDAFTPEARSRGLMFVPALHARSGMVFRYPANNRGGYWMKNTLIPLSIAYFDRDGRVLRVMHMAPCRQDPCQSYDPGVAYRGALEVNKGFFDRIGLRPGWRIELPPALPPAA